MNLQAFTANNPHVYRHEFNNTQAATDYDLLQRRIAALNARSEAPRVGDFVRLLDGSIRRFCYDWQDNGIQITPGESSGSFYISKDGFCDYSGSLEPCISTDKLRLTDETRQGRVWFFSGDFWRAHHGVYAMIEFRMYQVIL